MRVVFVFLFLLFNSIQTVRQGEIPTANESPWKISLQKQNVIHHWNGTKSTTMWFHFCGASLIASQIVYTAGHCVKAIESSLRDKEPVRVVAGEYNIVQNDPRKQYGNHLELKTFMQSTYFHRSMKNEGSVSDFWMENGYDLQIGATLLEIIFRVGTDVKKIANLPKQDQKIISNSYAKAVNMDHGLLFLKKPFDICSNTSHIRPAFLVEIKYNKSSCEVTGWGSTGEYNNYDGRPRKARVKSLVPIGKNNESLQATFHGNHPSIRTTLCNGDSGSGLVCSNHYREDILAGAFSSFLFEPKPYEVEKCQTALHYSMLMDAQRHIKKLYNVLKKKNFYYALKVDQMRCSRNARLLMERHSAR